MHSQFIFTPTFKATIPALITLVMFEGVSVKLSLTWEAQGTISTLVTLEIKMKCLNNIDNV